MNLRFSSRFFGTLASRRAHFLGITAQRPDDRRAKSIGLRQHCDQCDELL